MKWVTWENVGIDRIGCAWLILRDIDSKATFVFVPRGASLPSDAEPYDVPGVRFSHHHGHCSFHAGMGLNDAADDLFLGTGLSVRYR